MSTSTKPKFGSGAHRLIHLHKPHFGRDILIIAASVSLAVFIAQNDLVTRLVAASGGFTPMQALIGGFFFTSLLTITPAGVAFVEMAQFAPAHQLALWGATGAVLGDLVLFLLVRDVISEDMVALLRGSWIRKLKALFKSPFLAWVVPVAGALAIASPLPDEVGIALLGLSRSDVRFLIPISFAMNFLGIYLLCIAVAG